MGVEGGTPTVGDETRRGAGAGRWVPPEIEIVPRAVPVARALEPDIHQQEAISHAGTPGSGPLLVLAGPGTGKTATLVASVAARIEAGTPAERILILTFSRKAATELRDRIADRLGDASRGVAAWTFHAFCYALISRRLDALNSMSELGVPVTAPRVMTNPEQDVVIRELLSGHAQGEAGPWPQEWKEALATLGMAAELRTLFTRSVSVGFGPAELRRAADQSQREVWRSAADALEEYREVMAHLGRIDFAEMVERAVDVVESPQGGAWVRGMFDAVFVDEYQDTDAMQERLLLAIAGDGRDLFAVGDPDQSIYAFRGADIRNILRFPERFPHADGRPATVVDLKICRRSGQKLIDLAAAVSRRLPLKGGLARHGQDGFRDRQALTSSVPGAARIRLHSAAHDQYMDIADQLRRLHLDPEHPVPWAEMAVLVRSGVHSIPPLRRTLQAAGIPVEVAGDEIPLRDDPAIRPLLLAVKLVATPDECSSGETMELLRGPLGRMTPPQLRDLGRRLRQRARESAGPRGLIDSSDDLIHQAVLDPGLLDGLDGRGAFVAQRVGELLLAARRSMTAGGTAHEVLWELWQQKNFASVGEVTWLERLQAQAYKGGPQGRDADRDLDALVAFFTVVARDSQRTGAAAVRSLTDQLWSQEFPADTLAEEGVAGQAVRLMTAHRSKGLEWDVVVVADVQEELWPDVRRRGGVLESDLLSDPDSFLPPSPAEIVAEERRLFFVAVTRAKRELIITAVDGADDGNRRSRFIDEVLDHLDLTVADCVIAHDASVEDLGAGVMELVAELRRALLNPATPDDERQAAIALLAHLSEERTEQGDVIARGADPSAWWGLIDLSDAGADAFPEGDVVALSGSKLETLDSCPLKWFFSNAARAEGPRSDSMARGSVIHAVIAEGARQGSNRDEQSRRPVDIEPLTVALADAWQAIGFDAPWQAAASLPKAQAVLEVFFALHKKRQEAGTRVWAEEHFDTTMEVAGRTVRLSGSIDRIELSSDGRVRIVDIKTGTSTKTRDEAAQDPQLGLYQWAVAKDLVDLDDQTGQLSVDGAELAYPAVPTAKGEPTLRTQPALAASESDAEALDMDALITNLVEVVAGNVFPARPDEGLCTHCDFQQACPAKAGQARVVS